MSEQVMEPSAVEFETARGLLVRQFQHQDVPAYFNLHNKNRFHLLQEYEGGRDDTGHKYLSEEEMLQSFIAPKDVDKLRFGIWQQQKLIGTINLTPLEEGTAKIGYWMDEGHQGQGHTSDALEGLVEYAASQGYKTLVGEVLVGNGASRKVLEKAGFKIHRTFERLNKGVTEWLWELRLDLIDQVSPQ